MNNMNDVTQALVTIRQQLIDRGLIAPDVPAPQAPAAPAQETPLLGVSVPQPPDETVAMPETKTPAASVAVPQLPAESATLQSVPVPPAIVTAAAPELTGTGYVGAQASAITRTLLQHAYIVKTPVKFEALGYGSEAERKVWLHILDKTADTMLAPGALMPRELQQTYIAVMDYVIADMEKQAVAASNQDFFAAAASERWGLIRDGGRRLYKAVRERMQAKDAWPEPMSKFAVQAEATADAKTDKMMNPEKGEARKQEGVAAAQAVEGSLVQVARRIARELAAHGPITIDDVTLTLNRDYKVEPGANGTRQSWKGSVFSTGEWVAVGNMPSRLPEAHARPVVLWALREWLQKHTLNGTGGVTSSAYNLERIHGDFRHVHTGMDLARCNWYIGEECVANEIRDSIVKAGNMYMGVPVTFVPGGVGAILMAPDYTKQIQPKAPVQP